MLFQTAILALASLASVAQAQYYIDPESVSINIRNVWCRNEKETCPLICEQTGPGTTLVNTCDPATLQYGCLCGDNKRPNITEYSLTIPYFVCQEWGNQCVTACASGDNACASSCRQDHPCGAQNPVRVTTSSATLKPTASATEADENTIFTGTPGEPDEQNNDGDDADSAAPSLKIYEVFPLVLSLGAIGMAIGLM